VGVLGAETKADVRCNSVHPGGALTPLYQRQAEELAGAVVLATSAGERLNIVLSSGRIWASPLLDCA
jgi:hypothetical protein